MLLSGADTWIQFFTVLIIFILVLVLCYFTTRFIAGYQKGQMSRHNVEVIDTFRIAQNKYIQIVKIGGKYLALGICKDTMSVLCELEESELKFLEDEEKKPASFKDIWEKVKTKK